MCLQTVLQSSLVGPISPSNLLCKYTDDTYLLVPATNSSSVPQEIQHITNWATAKLNNSKSQEMNVHLPHQRKHFTYPTVIPNIVRVDKLNILGITVSDTLTFHHHISALVAESARSLMPSIPFALMGLTEKRCGT